jgi:hypothetical protein
MLCHFVVSSSQLKSINLLCWRWLKDEGFKMSQLTFFVMLKPQEISLQGLPVNKIKIQQFAWFPFLEGQK